MISTLLKTSSTIQTGTNQRAKESTALLEKKTLKHIPIGVCVIPKKESSLKIQSSQNGSQIINTCLNQTLLNELFNKNYPDLLEYTEKAIRALNRNVDSSTMISESYLHIHKTRDKIHSEADLVSFCKNFIKCNLRWTNSPVLRNERAISVEYSKLEYDSYDPDPRVQEWINEWEKTLKNIDRRLWDLWYHKNLRKGKEFANHLNISISGSYTYIKQCKLLEDALRKWITEKLV